jgi:catechol 2,3-dioxygenase-like lactoylglutathione lyase family enzyme
MTDTPTRFAVGVHHVSIDVDDVEACDRFYLDVLGFERIPRPDLGFAGTWMLAANNVQLHLVHRDGASGPNSNHFALQVVDIEDSIAALRGQGIEISDPIPINGGYQAFMRDPSNNIVELNQPPA